MHALVIDSNRTLSLRDRPKPHTDGECVIRVTAAGICGTDLELLRGYAGFSGVQGHEFVGVVEEADAADAAWIGRRVVGEITVGCERCAGCLAAGRGHCDVRTVLGIIGRDGAFADYLRLPATNLLEVPAALDDEAAVFVEPTAAACRILEQMTIESGMNAAVVGAGRLGLLVAQVLRAAGARVTLVVRRDVTRPVIAALGFTAVTVDAAVEQHARQFDVVVDATGDPAGFRAAAALLRPRGTLVLKSTIHGETPVAFSPLVVDEITVIGSRCGPFDRAIAMLAAGQVDVKPMMAGSYRLEQFETAFEEAGRGLKVLLRPGA